MDHRGLVYSKASEGPLKGHGQDGTSSEVCAERNPVANTFGCCPSHRTD